MKTSKPREDEKPSVTVCSTDTSEDRRADRERMVATQIEARGIHDPLVLDAMRSVPREAHWGSRVFRVDPDHLALAD